MWDLADGISKQTAIWDWELRDNSGMMKRRREQLFISFTAVCSLNINVNCGTSSLLPLRSFVRLGASEATTPLSVPNAALHQTCPPASAAGWRHTPPLYIYMIACTLYAKLPPQRCISGLQPCMWGGVESREKLLQFTQPSFNKVY